MIQTEPEDRAAILLSILGEDAAESFLAQMSPQRRDQVQRRISELAELPPPASDVDRVMEEFEQFFRFAKSPDVRKPRIADTPDEDSEAADVQTATKKLLKPSKDPIADLDRLEPYQIAGALQSEHPRTIAIVLGQVPTEKVSGALNYLPSDVRTEVFLQMRGRPQGSEHLIKQIARATFENGREIAEDDVVVDDTGADQRLAEILRSLEKKERNELLAVIEENDPEGFARVNDLLYVFDDVIRIDDRSLQKLLSDVETRVLAKAVNNADEALVDRIQKNLPKRAREMLAEEMQLMGPVSEDDREAARKEITTVIAQLDQAGELVMES
jgi:flagellar motor switch protein FliG